MNQNPAPGNPLGRLWMFLTSVRLTVVLLLSLAVASVFGTLIPQNLDPVLYVRQFGTAAYRVFVILDLVDLYHAGWFRLLLGFLAVNVMACSIQRFPGTWRILTAGSVPGGGRGAAGRGAETFRVAVSPEHLQERIVPLVKTHFGRPHIAHTAGKIVMAAERGRWTRLGFYLVHLSIVLLLAGGLVGSMFGFDGFVQIPEGGSVNMARLSSGQGAVPIGFDIRCDDFSVSFYEGGRPKEYRSRLTLIENGNEILTRDIVVNAPLRYRGINIFQSSYGLMGPGRYYTGLQVTRDPGVWLVYLGFFFLITGCFVTFFTAHRKLFVEIVSEGPGSCVRVWGSANKNRSAMQGRVRKIAAALSGTCK